MDGTKKENPTENEEIDFINKVMKATTQKDPSKPSPKLNTLSKSEKKLLSIAGPYFGPSQIHLRRIYEQLPSNLQGGNLTNKSVYSVRVKLIN